MFRYIALAWEPARPAAAALAGALADALRAHPAWRAELVRPRWCVFSTGTVAGTNEAYRLHDERGVVLGRLFQREAPQTTTERIAEDLVASAKLVTADGRDLLDRYWGRYVAFIETASGELKVLRDPSGTLPCFMLDHGGVTVVFSWLEDLITLLPQIPVRRVRLDGLAAHMAFGELTGRHTALEGVTQVLAGEQVALGQGGDQRGCLLWDAAELARRPAELGRAEAMASLRETVSGCAQAWAGCYGSVLLRLSGGLDSSILASCLAEGRTPTRVTCLNYHSVGSDSDEREFARLAAAMARRELIEYEREPEFRLERVLDAARTPAPTNHVGRMTSSSDAEIANVVGAPAMFTGGGGDQLFFEARQWWPAADYLRLRGFDGGFAGAMVDAARLGKVSVWKAVRLALADRFRRLPPALDLHTHLALISDAVRDRARHPAEFVHPVFVSPCDLPIGKFSQVQQLAHSGGYYDPFARDDAPELVRPLLSQPLIDLCLRLPTYVLTHGGRGRALVRDAFEGQIPEAIAHRRSKGGMGDHVKAVLDRNLDFARQMLLDGQLARLGLLDRTAVELALSDRQSPRKAQAGEIHLCIGVEAWLQSWSPNPRGSG